MEKIYESVVRIPVEHMVNMKRLEGDVCNIETLWDSELVQRLIKDVCFDIVKNLPINILKSMFSIDISVPDNLLNLLRYRPPFTAHKMAYDELVTWSPNEMNPPTVVIKASLKTPDTDDPESFKWHDMVFDSAKRKIANEIYENKVLDYFRGFRKFKKGDSVTTIYKDREGIIVDYHINDVSSPDDTLDDLIVYEIKYHEVFFRECQRDLILS